MTAQLCARTIELPSSIDPPGIGIAQPGISRALVVGFVLPDLKRWTRAERVGI